MRSLAELLHEYPHILESGLTDAEASESRRKYGANRLTPIPREPVWRLFLAKFDEPIIKILLGASLLKIIVDLFSITATTGGIALGLTAATILLAVAARWRDWLPTILFADAVGLFVVSALLGHPSVEGLAVIVAVILATGVSFISEYRSGREFDRLNSQKDAAHVKVHRSGVLRSIPMDEVVVADRVVLEMGDEIPADGRVISSNDWKIDQSLLTGESEPVKKVVSPAELEEHGPDNPGCLYRGTQVIDGLGEMIVCHVGDDTMIGQIARNLAGDHDPAAQRVQNKLTIAREQTPLQEKLTVLAGLISRVGYVAAIAIFLALFTRGLFASPREIFWPHNQTEWLFVLNHLLEYFVYMVIVIVVAVPEGLPMSVTVSLALAMRKMTRSNALVRQLMATETIGSATIICSDKTGTLTQNRMAVVGLPVEGERLWLIRNAAINSTATLEEKQGKWVVVGNSTEGALLNWLKSQEVEYTKIRLATPTIHRFTFSSDTKRMTTLARVDHQIHVFVKGAPESVLARCSHYRDHLGGVHPLDDAIRRSFLHAIQHAAEEAMRTLAFADRGLPPGFREEDHESMIERREELETDLIFAGVVAIRDPIREDVPEAVARCKEAGIRVMMITGDNLETARAIAREIGLIDIPDALMITSTEFNAMSDDELKADLPRLRVLARARPMDKYRMVKLLQEQGHVVAMTGDGTNDAPSLKKADVGLAMGITGTEVAKEASKIVLLDDSFATIVRAVHWGRALYENIQRFLVFQLTINVSALLIAFLGPFLGVKPPFTVLQLLWINVIMDTFAAMALCSEPPRRGLMSLPPKKRSESIVTKSMMVSIGATAGFFIVVMLILLFGMTEESAWFRGAGELSEDFPGLTARQVTFFFTIYVFFQVWNQINCRSLSRDVSGFAGLHRNPVFLAIAALTVVGQFLIVTFGGIIFAVEPLGLNDWLAIAGGTSCVLLFGELLRWIRRRVQV